MEANEILILNGIGGTPGRIRTCDLLLRRQPLYPSELQAHTLKVLILKTADSQYLLLVGETHSRSDQIPPTHAPAV